MPTTPATRLASLGLTTWAAVRAAATALLAWAMLTGGDREGWWYGITAAILCASLMLGLGLGREAPRISLLALPGFLLFFFWMALAGGLDVARRAVAPSLRLDPGWIEHDCERLRDRWSLVLFAASLSLMPGTLCWRIRGHRVSIHVLDVGNPPTATFLEAERRISRLLISAERSL